MPRTTSGRWLAGAAVIVGLLIVFSIVMAVLNRDREPDLLPAGSPGRAVQDYILAVQREDPQAAHALLSEEAREQCDTSAIYGGHFSLPRDSFSIRLVDTQEGDDTAVVEIEITEIDAPGEIPLLGGSVDSYDTTYRLVREQGGWRLGDSGWPGWSCPRRTDPTPPATTTAGES